MTWVLCSLVSVRLEIMLASVQDTCTVCATCRAHKSIWTQLIVVLGDEARVEYLVSVNLDIVLMLMQDTCTVCATCTIGSEIVLDAADGTPR